MTLSAYALYVESQHEKYMSKEFKSLCDIPPMKIFGFELPNSSCSEVFAHPAGKIWSYLGLIPKDSSLDQPNALYGFIFYVVIALTALMRKNIIAAHVALFFGLFSVILSVYLAYILAYVMHHFCILCVSTYVVNFSIFFVSLKKLRDLRRELKDKKKAN